MTASASRSEEGPGERRAPELRRGAPFTSIVHVNEKGGSFGGTEEYIALLTSGLSARGVRTDLVCGVITGELPTDLSSVHIVEGLASRQAQHDTAGQLAGVIAALDPDVIYLHNVFDAAAVAAVAALPGRGPLIWYVHDHYVTCLSELRWRRDIGSCQQRLGHDCLATIANGSCVLRYPDRDLDEADLAERLGLSRSLGLADAIVVVSDYMRTLLANAEPNLGERLRLVARPIRDLGDVRIRDRQHRADPAIITYAGRITAEKGLGVVIEALGATPSEGPIELRIAGAVEDDAYWTRCRHLQTSATSANPLLGVTYLGHLDYEATDELFRQSDIVVVPSQWPEPLGAVALEAMSAGAAVVASRRGGLANTLVDNHNGLLVDPPDVDHWTTAITSLLDNPEHARQLGYQAHQDVAGIAIADHLAALDRIVAEC